MSILKIQGPIKLKGEVSISGAKNAALPIMVASLLNEESYLYNVPNLTDIYNMSKLLNSIGMACEKVGRNSLRISRQGDLRPYAPYEYVTAIRPSFIVLGPLAAILGEADISLPGGCSIGPRPVDIHIKGLKKLGFDIKIEHGIVKAKVGKKLKGTEIYLDFPSVGATEHLMITASIIEGTTVLFNAAREPEIVDLARFLNKSGYHIRGAGGNKIIIKGKKLSKNSIAYKVMPDRIEAGTFMIAAASSGDIIVNNINVEYLKSITYKLLEIGVKVHLINNVSVRITGSSNLSSTDVTILPYPGFPTDLQAPLMALLSLVNGTSTVKEMVFPNRFAHVPELIRMGADIRIDGSTAIINGVKKLEGADVTGLDLRATAALVIAALSAEGITTIHNVDHIFRGYENIIKKFSKLGASIKVEEINKINKISNII
jgi:UDP-N-acetylglucosamine 1-carboxyvinyltransferase